MLFTDARHNHFYANLPHLPRSFDGLQWFPRHLQKLLEWPVFLQARCPCGIQCENSLTFLDFQISQGSIQHIAGEMEIFIVCTWRIFLRISWRKNFENRSTFAKVIIKHQVAYFFETTVFYDNADSCTPTWPHLRCDVGLHLLMIWFWWDWPLTWLTTIVRQCYDAVGSYDP